MKYKWDKKYLYWGITAFLVLAAASVFFILLSEFKQVAGAVGTFLGILTPVLYGFIIAYVLSPVATFIEKPCLRRLFYTIQDKKRERFERLHPGEEPPPRTFPVRRVARVMSVVITMMLALALVIGLIWIVLPEMITTVNQLVSQMPTYAKQLTTWVSETLENYPEAETYVLQFTNGFSDMLNKWLSTELLPSMTNIWDLITTNVMTIISVSLNLLLGFVIAIYFLNSKELFAAQFKKVTYCLFKTRTANKLIGTVRDIHKSFGQFITGTLINAFIVGAMYIVVLSIFDMEYAILISVIMGITCIIPYFGPFIGAVPCMLLLLLADPWQCVSFFIIMMVIQLLDGNVISPKIIGDSTGLSSFWVIFGMLVGQGIFGFAGLIIGIPLFAVIYAFVKGRVVHGLERHDLPQDSDDYREIHHIDEETGEPVLFPHPPYKKKDPEKRSFRLSKKKKKDASEPIKAKTTSETQDKKE
ncbi:MAG: AI-2E family transporter [Eubacterium sp.]|nr:AI-2E family transporter [Eubacterium sp.]